MNKTSASHWTMGWLSCSRLRAWRACALVVSAAAVVTFAAALPRANAAEARPLNVVFFLADDLGQRDLGVYGSTFHETPNLDQMARDGARFTQAYAACPVCSPTRASVQTGRYPQRTSITDYIGAAQPDRWERNTILRPAPYSDRLAHDEVTLAEMLKQAGYATFFAGKWHLGVEGWWPENQGYAINKGGVQAGSPPGGGRYFSPYGNPRLEDGPKGEHLPDRLAEETNTFITANKDRPFLAFYAFYDVHTPLMAREDLRKKYEAKRQRLGLQPKFGSEPPRDVRQVQEHAVYAAMVEAMDLAVGKVLAKLDELGLRENTLVIFTSDNGGLSTSEGSPTSNLPLRAGKGWLYEGGIRVPLLVRWPGVVEPGRVIDSPVTSPDFLPTIHEATRIAARLPQKIDGVSMVPLLRGGGLGRPLYWHYPHYGNQGGAPGGAVRQDDFKLIEWYEDGRRELYNLRDDVGEQKDLSAAMPDKVKYMAELLANWRRDVGAVMPSRNAAYDPGKPTGRLPQTAGQAGKAKAKKK